jgi:Leucine-rich repeat (LRR) protein
MISDTSSLAKCRGLGVLNLSHNQITDLAFLTHMSGVAELDLSANRISKLDELLNCDWITSRVPSPYYGYQSYNFDFSGNPIDCTEQASNIQALRNYAINLTVDCP